MANDGKISALLNRRKFLGVSGTVAGVSVLGNPASAANGTNRRTTDEYSVTTSFVQLDDGVPGLLYDPVPQSKKAHGKKGEVGIVFMHPDGDFLTHDGGEGMASRGYRVLTANTSATAKGRYHLHDLLPEVGKAVEHLRDMCGVKNVILAGHSGGAHLFSFYQNVAENGVQACQDDDRLYPCPSELESLPPADGLILLDGHMGYGVKGLLELGPALANPDEPNGSRIEAVDMYDPDNGFDPDGKSSYGDGFLKDFFAAQAARMNDLIDHAQERVDAMESGDGTYPDDEPLIIPDTKSRIYKPDPTILSKTQEEWPLLRPDGSVSERVVESLRGPADTDSRPPIDYLGDEVMTTTIRKFLSTNASRPLEGYKMTEDSIEGIDYSSSNANTPGNLETVSVPVTMIGATGHYHVVQNEIFWNHAGSSDKSLVYVEGASHGFSAIAPEYGDPESLTFDYMHNWIVDRFR